MSKVCLDCAFEPVECAQCKELRDPLEVDENNICKYCNNEKVKNTA